jgi:hypothetical protein
MRLDMERADKATQRSIDWYNAHSQRISATRPRASGDGESPFKPRNLGPVGG